MTNKQFDQLAGKRIAEVRKVLFQKAQTYGQYDDRLSSFKLGAVVNTQLSNTKEHPCQNLHGIFIKPLVKYYQMIEAINKGEKIAPSLVEEVFTDLHNYLLLQEGLITELALGEDAKPVEEVTTTV